MVECEFYDKNAGISYTVPSRRSPCCCGASRSTLIARLAVKKREPSEKSRRAQPGLPENKNVLPVNLPDGVLHCNHRCSARIP
jgi:hypothetical protein